MAASPVSHLPARHPPPAPPAGELASSKLPPIRRPASTPLAAHRAAANGWRPASSSSTSSTDTITDREVLPWRGGPHRADWLARTGIDAGVRSPPPPIAEDVPSPVELR